MQTVRESWTDERLDDRDLRLEVRAGFTRIDERFERMHRLMITLGGGLIVAVLTSHLF